MISVYKVKAKSFEGRVVCYHEFEMAGENAEDALHAVWNRWPELYDIEIEYGKTKQEKDP